MLLIRYPLATPNFRYSPLTAAGCSPSPWEQLRKAGGPSRHPARLRQLQGDIPPSTLALPASPTQPALNPKPTPHPAPRTAHPALRTPHGLHGVRAAPGVLVQQRGGDNPSRALHQSCQRCASAERGKAIPHRCCGNTLLGARPALPPRAHGRLCPPWAPLHSARVLPRHTAAAEPESSERVCSLGQTRSDHPEAAVSLSDKGFTCQQHPKPRGAERHSRDDSNTAPGGETPRQRTPAAVPGRSRTDLHPAHTWLPLHRSLRSLALTLFTLLDSLRKSLNEPDFFQTVSVVLNDQSSISYFLKSNCIQVPVLIHPFCLGGKFCHL